jgi:hypothetical protein
MDYETFGEHQWADTGIFDFVRALPAAIFDVAPGENHFITPSDGLEQFEPVGEYDVPNYLSWADTERDLSAWLGNAMQANALHETYKAEADIRKASPPWPSRSPRPSPTSPSRPSTCSTTGASSPPATTSTTCAPSTGPTATSTSTSAPTTRRTTATSTS